MKDFLIPHLSVTLYKSDYSGLSRALTYLLPLCTLKLLETVVYRIWKDYRAAQNVISESYICISIYQASSFSQVVEHLSCK